MIPQEEEEEPLLDPGVDLVVIREIIRDAVPEGEAYKTADVVNVVVEEFRTQYPDLYNEWATELANREIESLVKGFRLSHRSVMRQAINRLSARGELDQGIRTGQVSFLARSYSVNGSVKPLAKMLRKEVEAVANNYERRANTELLEAGFLRKVATKIPARSHKTVEEVLDDKALARVWEAIHS